MTNPLQLLRDFRKWRKEKYREKLIDTIRTLDNFPIPPHEPEICEWFREGILYGIEHRKEILKQVKI